MNHSINTNEELRGAPGVHFPRVYASPADFCLIFDEDMDSLYSLALLLTGNLEDALECFLAALHDCRTGSVVFPEWARSWSRRAVIKNAIRLRQPTFGNSSDGPSAVAHDVYPAARVVLELGPFERFVFVITVLESYSIRECAVLLGSTPREVQHAQLQALQAIAGDARDALLPQYADGARILRESVTVIAVH